MQIRLAPGVGFGPMPDVLPYAEFERQVRRLPRSALLRRCAAMSAALERVWPHRLPSVIVSVKPWSVAGVARTCLAAGTEDRSADASDDALARLCWAFIQIDNPAQGDLGIERVMTPLAFEQFGSQYSKMENLARSPALLLDHADGVPGAPTADDWADLLGVDLEQYMRIGFATYVAVVQNGGSVPRELLQAEHLAPIFAPVAATEALAVLDRHFVAPLDRLRDVARRAQLPGREKWSWNPLAATPLVKIGGDLVAPAAHLIIDKITPTGLYYTAAGVWGERFTDALGKMFENYIGTHLAQLAPQAVLHPEIVYGASEQKSCDYLLVFGEVVVLVEAKTTRPTMLVRSGQEGGEEPSMTPTERLRRGVKLRLKGLGELENIATNRDPSIQNRRTFDHRPIAGSIERDAHTVGPPAPPRRGRGRTARATRSTSASGCPATWPRSGIYSTATAANRPVT